ncbi:MAG: hypothetical protein K1X82_14515, partial [Bacteroidia bacterium]|nr:hypothetical protein [Bacteroidia bacterium]
GNHASGLGAGNYMAYVYSCDSTKVDSLAFSMTQPEQLQAAIAVSYQNNCNGSVSATLFAQASGGVGNYTYQWTQSTNGGQPTNVGEGYNLLNISSFANYGLSVVDANGDTSVAQINIQPAAQLSISANAVAKYGEFHTRCDVGDGEIQVQLSGGISPYALHINGNINMGGYTTGFSRDTTVNDTSFTLHGFGAGNVGISVTDAGGCSANLSQNINMNKPGTPEVFVTGEVRPNGYYFSCDTCTDAQLSADLGNVNQPISYKWYSIPGDFSRGMKLEGASIMQIDEGEPFTGEGLSPFSTASSINQITPGVLNKLVATDALGCVTSSTIILEKPKPFTQGWALNGNIGLDTTAYIGTKDSVDVVLKSNGANNPQPQLKLKASGGVEVNGPAKFSGMVKVPNMAEATDPNQEFKLVSIGTDGILKSGPSFKPGSGCSPTFGWGNVYNQFATYTNDIIKCPAIGNVGIGITTLPQAKLHVLGNFKLDGEVEITGSRLFVSGITGQIGINTNNIPLDYKLAVNGKIITEEVQVQLHSEWPDYVFGKSYKLITLDEVSDYIQRNNHLPGLPNAKYVKEFGVSIGEMEAILLEKIEELTLYVIQLKNEIEMLKTEQK